MLAPGQAVIFLKLVGAIEGWLVFGDSQACADAEAIDGGGTLPERDKVLIVEAAARKDGGVLAASLVEDAPDGLESAIRSPLSSRTLPA